MAGKSYNRSLTSQELNLVRKSLGEGVFERLSSRASMDKKKERPKKQTTETTNDFSSSNKANDSFLIALSSMPINEQLKKRLERYWNFDLEEKINLQREIIEAITKVLKDEKQRRFDCEKHFERTLLQDSNRIADLVIFPHSGGAPGVSAEIKRFNNLV